MTRRTMAVFLVCVAWSTAATAAAQTTSTSTSSTSTSSSSTSTSTSTTSTTVPNPCAGRVCTDAPPPAFLAGVNGEVRLDDGSYCWQVPSPTVPGGFTGLCLDKIAKVPDALLRVQAGETLTLRFGAAMTPTVVTLELGTQQAPLAAGNPVRFVADLPVGIHEVRVFTRWPQGDASYTVRLDVRAAPRPIALTG